METTISTFIPLQTTRQTQNNTWKKLLAIADAQAGNKTFWYLFSLIFQGVLFLPIPAVLMYYYQAPIFVLPITFALYLGNIIVGMGGSGIRVVIGFFIFTVVVNLTMLAIYTL